MNHQTNDELLLLTLGQISGVQIILVQFLRSCTSAREIQHDNKLFEMCNLKPVCTHINYQFTTSPSFKNSILSMHLLLWMNAMSTIICTGFTGLWATEREQKFKAKYMSPVWFKPATFRTKPKLTQHIRPLNPPLPPTPTEILNFV